MPKFRISSIYEVIISRQTSSAEHRAPLRSPTWPTLPLAPTHLVVRNSHEAVAGLPTLRLPVHVLHLRTFLASLQILRVTWITLVLLLISSFRSAKKTAKALSVAHGATLSLTKGPAVTDHVSVPCHHGYIYRDIHRQQSVIFMLSCRSNRSRGHYCNKLKRSLIPRHKLPLKVRYLTRIRINPP